MNIVTVLSLSKISLLFLTVLLFFFFFTQNTFAITYYPPGTDPYDPDSSFAHCYDPGCRDDINLDDCTDYGGQSKDNVCYQNPWNFKYAARCRVCTGDEPICDFNYEYEYNECNTEDRCWGSDTGASGYDPAAGFWQEGVVPPHMTEVIPTRPVYPVAIINNAAPILIPAMTL